MRRFLPLAAALVAALPVVGHAQGAAPAQPIELGIDGGIAFGLDSPHYTAIALPGQRFRVGFFTRENLSIEPSAAINYLHVGGVSSTGLLLDGSVLYHFAPTTSGSRVYLRPYVGVDYARASSDNGSDSQTQLHFGGGLGVKVPLVPRLATRLEANLEHALKAGNTPANTLLGLSVGLSFFTR